MALRFRRTLKIAPGVRINLTGKGISARVGPRGLGATVGTSGTTLSAGIPGSGLHASKKLTKGRAKSTRIRASQADQSTEAKPGLGFFGWVGVLAIGVFLIWIFA